MSCQIRSPTSRFMTSVARNLRGLAADYPKRICDKDLPSLFNLERIRYTIVATWLLYHVLTRQTVWRQWRVTGVT